MFVPPIHDPQAVMATEVKKGFPGHELSGGESVSSSAVETLDNPPGLGVDHLIEPFQGHSLWRAYDDSLTRVHQNGDRCPAWAPTHCIGDPRPTELHLGPLEDVHRPRRRFITSTTLSANASSRWSGYFAAFSW